ncbi:MAG: helix-turn-helix transcriptional regulator [Erysipelotrichaceae bacterium]|nr:helix-turn-helix transcriptional regulator [Erysipelotrichaceae bacterium]
MISKELYKEIEKYIKDNYVEEDLYYPNDFLCVCGQALDIDLKPEATFSETLLKLIDERKLSDSQAYGKANIDRRLFSKIRSNKNYNPSRNTVLAFCIALNLDIDTAEDLLERAGYALGHSTNSDLIIRLFLEKKKDYTLFDVDDALMSFNLKPISKY